MHQSVKLTDATTFTAGILLPSFMLWLTRVHPSLVEFLRWTLLSICLRTYFHTSKGHVA